MQDGFDPYYKWLGIPPEEQPPHHYRLLAIPLFESDPEVIESAADQRMGHVRTFQNGRYSSQSQHILNELAAARVCLLSHQKKQAYDGELRTRLAPAAPPPPPTLPPVAAILPSPPPPVGQSPLTTPVPSPTDREIPPPPADSLLSQANSTLTPLSSPPPEPPPPVAITPVGDGPKRLSVVAGTAGATLLVIAAVAAGMLYSYQKAQDTAISSLTPSVSAPRVTPETPGPVDPSTQAIDEDNPTDKDADESVPQNASAVSDTMDPVVEESPPSLDDPGAEEDASSQPPEPPVDPRSMAADPAEEGTESLAPTTPTLGDLLTVAENTTAAGDARVMQSSPAADEGAAEDSTEQKADEKWRVPKPAVLSRVANKMQPPSGSFSTLLVEAQQSDRPETEVYILLTTAHNKAVAALDANGALQALDLIESKFYENCDDQRFNSLRAIGAQLLKKRSSPRTFQELADAALRASQEALDEKNLPLARKLGSIALEAAGHARDTLLQQRVQTHLDQL